MAPNVSVTDGNSTRTSPQDWSASYSYFLSRATAQAAATLGLYQQALLKVSEGKLEPTAFQNEFPRFAQQHGAEYANKLSNLGARFLSRLVEISAAHSRLSFESPAAGAVESEITPPRFEPDYPARWFEQFAEYAGKLYNRAVRTYRSQLDAVASGEMTPAQVQQRAVDDLSHKLPPLLQEMTALYFDLLNGLNEIRADYERDYFRGVLALADQPEREPPVLLNVTAPRGETGFVSLSIANTTDKRRAIRFAHTDARRIDGAEPAFKPEIGITPENLELDPGEEQRIQLSIVLNENDYDEGAPYTCTLYISGGDALRVEVDLRIVATALAHSANNSHNAG